MPVQFETYEQRSVAVQVPHIEYVDQRTGMRSAVSLEDLETDGSMLDDLDDGIEVVLVGLDDAVKGRFEAVMKKHGKGMNLLQYEPPANTITEAKISIETLEDEVVRRGIAKVVFNYYAKVRGAAFALHERFDGIRDYVLKGDSSRGPLVQQIRRVTVHAGSFLPADGKGHMVLVADTPGHSGAFGDVTLFGRHVYRVHLGNALQLYVPAFASGHFFALEEKAVRQLIVESFTNDGWSVTLQGRTA